MTLHRSFGARSAFVSSRLILSLHLSLPLKQRWKDNFPEPLVGNCDYPSPAESTWVHFWSMQGSSSTRCHYHEMTVTTRLDHDWTLIESVRTSSS